MFDEANNMHTASCLAAALICAVENVRDSANDSIHSRFAPITEHAAAGEVYAADYVAIASGYLADGLTGCRCAV